jgi:hypothetical protein
VVEGQKLGAGRLNIDNLGALGDISVAKAWQAQVPCQLVRVDSQGMRMSRRPNQHRITARVEHTVPKTTSLSPLSNS